MTRVALLATGRMGSAMARSLARNGMELTLYNRTPERARGLAEELDARVAEAPARAAAEAEICLTMLADSAAVDAVWDGPNGLLAGARSGSVLADMSTVPPETLKAYAERAAACGAGILDAPVSGSVPLAESGSLTIMVGGEADALERARPAFDALAKQVLHIGPLGTGAAMKLAVNTLIFGLNQALAEALTLAEQSGIDRAMAYDAFAASAAAAPYVGYKRAAFVEPERTPVAFSLGLAEKDLRLITESAARLGVPMPQAEVDLELVQAAAAGIGAEKDASSVAAHLRTLATEQRSRKGSN